MSDLITLKATFQGYPVQALSISRKPGISSDGGWVELQLKDVKKIVVKDDFRLWQSANLKEPAGPMILKVAKQIRRATITTLPGPEGDGLDRGGTLKMETFIGDGAGAIDSVSLVPMFLAPGGLEEMIDDLESAIQHKEGRVRINLVDFRHFWQRNGTPVFGRYNMLLENGAFDEATIDQDTGKPHSLADMLNMIALSLPGSPSINPKSDSFDITLRAPVNIDMKCDLPITWLQKLLRGYDLECHLTHSSQLLFKRRGREHKVRQFRRVANEAPRKLPAPVLPDNPTLEKKTVFVLDRPEAVTVVGDRRQRRHKAPCVAAFKDEDDKIKDLRDIGLHWKGYSFEKALAQALLRSEKSYQDIPGDSRSQKMIRTAIAQKYFFKMFVPDFLFTPRPPTGGKTPSATQARVFWEFEKRSHLYMPMIEPWFVPKEIKDIPKTLIKNLTTPVNKSQNPLVQTTGVLIRANLIAQRNVKDLSAATEIANAFLETHGELIDRISAQEREKERELKRLQSLEKPDEFKEYGDFSGAAVLLNKFKDSILENILVAIPDVNNRIIQTAKLRAWARGQRDIVRFEIRQLTENGKEARAAVLKIKSTITQLFRDMEDFGVARLWVNVPWAVVEAGEFAFDKEKGHILFDRVVGVMSAAGTYDLENVEYLGPGHVEIQFMTELVLDSPTEMSTWTFLANQDDPTGNPSLVRVSDFSNVKPHIIKDESLVMMEDELQRVMNAQVTAEAAAVLARSVLVQPRQQDGYQYEYPGFWRVITDDSVNEVAWEYDGDMGHTKIIANNPEVDAGYQSLARKRASEDLFYGR